jgi:flagellar biogenesis protein FliO
VKRILPAILLALLAASLAAGPLLAADPPSLEEHAGKPINRDAATTSSSPAAPAVGVDGSQSPQTPQNSMDFDSGRVALALIGVIGLILLLRYMSKQIFPSVITGGRTRTVTVLARCPLAPRQQVVLIQVGRRIIVAADCASQLSSLCQITDPDEVAALVGQIQSDRAAPIGSPFTAWFNRAAEAFGAEAAAAEDPAEPVPAAESEEIGKLTERVRGLARQWGSQEKNAQA